MTSVVLLFLQQKSLQALRVLFGQLHLAQQHFFDDDLILGEASGDGLRGALMKFLALGRENVAHYVTRTRIAKNAGDNRRDDLLVNWLREICLNIVEMAGSRR